MGTIASRESSYACSAMSRRSRRRLTTRFVASLACVSTSACVQHTRCEYERQVVALDERNELVISTFPSGYPQIRRRVPFLFKRLESPRSVKVQFFVRARGTAAGPNPNIDSILVRSFSYAFPGQAPVLLMENFPGGFWQQGAAEDRSEAVESVPCSEGWYIRARFDLMLNGRPFTGEQTLVAREKSRVDPMVLDVLR